MAINQGEQTGYWQIDDGQAKRGLIEAVKGAYSVHVCPAEKHSVVVYDSFPWQLWYSGYVLYREEDRLVLREFSEDTFGRVLAEAEIQGEAPWFYRQLPDSLKELLKSHLRLRALLEKIRYIRTETVYEIKNEDQKTVSRIVISEYKRNSRGKIFLRTAISLPVRGYQKDLSALHKLLGSLGLKRSDSSPLYACFEACNCRPESYSSKPVYNLRGSQITHEAILESVTESVKMARKCEFGIMQDLDTEFLHDYRVCLRSIRAILARIKGVFSPEIQSQLAKEFSDLGSKTNRLRDLDVYLLKESRYKEMVPENLSEALGDMFDDYRSQRIHELNKIRRYFRSRTYAEQVKRIESLIESAHSEVHTGIGQKPVYDVACRRIKKQYRKVLGMGRELHHRTSDDAIHRLRLECKKLRYLLEYFAPLYDEEMLAILVSSMKELQDTLGIFNDLSVQQGSLQQYYASSNSGNPLLGVAIGVLIGSMYRGQKKMRRKVVSIFDAFDSPRTHKRFRKLMLSQVEGI